MIDVKAATFDEMQSNADHLTPDIGGIFKNRAVFFRGGRSGSGVQLLSAEEMGRYHVRSEEVTPKELLGWLHRSR